MANAPILTVASRGRPRHRLWSDRTIPETGELVDGGTAAELRQAQERIEAFEEAGAALTDVVKATIFILDMSDFDAVTRSGWIPSVPHCRLEAPSRSPNCLCGAKAEVEFFAYSPER